jgi:hypothetical protein
MHMEENNLAYAIWEQVLALLSSNFPSLTLFKAFLICSPAPFTCPEEHMWWFRSLMGSESVLQNAGHVKQATFVPSPSNNLQANWQSCTTKCG